MPFHRILEYQYALIQATQQQMEVLHDIWIRSFEAYVY